MKPITQFLDLIEGVRQCEGGWRAKCPAHEDRQPSLSVSEGDDGRVLVSCHAGCSVESICGAIGLKVADLFPEDSKVPTSTKPQKTTETARSRSRPKSATPATTFSTLADAIAAAAQSARGTVAGQWTYHDAGGDEVFVVVRLQSASGKTFRPVRRVASGWQLGGPPGPLPLYRLSELVGADRVYVVEGEKAAEAARSIGFVATTSAHGAKSPRKSDWSPLAGKDIVVLPDHDSAGRDYAAKVAAILTALSPPARVRIVELPGLPEHGDIVDVLEQRDAADPETLKETIEKLADATPLFPGPLARKPVLQHQPFPVEVLPQPLRDFVAAGAASIGCDPSFIALPLLSAVASAIGNSRRIELKRGWSEPAILWTACVGESGSHKTPAFRLVMRPLHEQQTKALAEHEIELANFERQWLDYDKSLGDWKHGKLQGLPPVKPLSPEARRFVVTDATVEALAPLLRSNPRGLLMARDELSGWIGSFDRYTSGKGADAANWLSMHGGETLVVDRKTGTPRIIYVPRASVSVTGGIQPGILSRSLGIEHRESGLAARLLLTWPPRQAKRWTDDDIDPAMEATLDALFAGLLRLAPLSAGDDGFQPVLLPLSGDAKQAWVKFYNEHAQQQVDLDGDLAAAWSKLEDYAARLALVIHCVRCVAGDRALASADTIDVASIVAGVALSRWLGNEARRIYAMLGESDDERRDRQIVDQINRHGGHITVRELHQSSRDYTTADDARGALDRLVKAGLGTWEAAPKSGNGGRPSEKLLLLRRPTPIYETSTNAEFAVVS